MPHYLALSLIDNDFVKEMKPILEFGEYDEYIRQVFGLYRVGPICDVLMEILDVDYGEEMNFHVLTPDRIESIISTLEIRIGEWESGMQTKTNKFIDALKEQRDTFAFEGEDSLLLSWAI